MLTPFKPSETARRERERGSAILVVVILIGIMGVYLVSNAISLVVLNRELKLIEAKQLKQLATPQQMPGAAAGTNDLLIPKVE